ncbi:hypothetical protein TEQG_02417 [Trichophyton equinum CBS 127.97]|uniref:Uncharacterized protein n=1 Tax=Trichophyton equinum (strain ATCC MYA-4606 / CBS 127.97) TaxID=559882 RepID=F2PNB4_TRIEC|nr:hypothetical protein TEQG_02417 [Trichophyton equinum CBS 127.97]
MPNTDYADRVLGALLELHSVGSELSDSNETVAEGQLDELERTRQLPSSLGHRRRQASKTPVEPLWEPRAHGR